MKYVINERSGLETPVIFPEYVQHDVYGNANSISAGFVEFEIGQDECGKECVVPVCYGKSISLGKVSRGQVDSDCIKFSMRSI